MALFYRFRFQKKQLKFENIFEEVPVVLRSSLMARALLSELAIDLKTETFDRLDLSTHSYLEKNVRCLMDCVDQLSGYRCLYNRYFFMTVHIHVYSI